MIISPLDVILLLSYIVNYTLFYIVNIVMQYNIDSQHIFTLNWINLNVIIFKIMANWQNYCLTQLPVAKIIWLHIETDRKSFLFIFLLINLQETLWWPHSRKYVVAIVDLPKVNMNNMVIIEPRVAKFVSYITDHYTTNPFSYVLWVKAFF